MNSPSFSLFSPFNKSFARAMLQSRLPHSRLGSSESLQSEDGLRILLERPRVGLAIANANLDHSSENLVFTVRSKKSRRAYKTQGRKVSLAETAVSLTADVTPKKFIPEAKTKKCKRTFCELVDGFDLRTYTEEELVNLSDSQLLQLATERKDDALALQLYIENCSKTVLSKLAKVASSNIELLLCHPTGNFVVQKLIKHDAEFAKLASLKCRDSFHELALNEFSSRVMQCLIETDQDFRKYVLALFRDDLDSYIQSFSSAFLVSVAIRHAETDAERDIIRNTLKFNPKRWLTKKYYKRVLVAYISNCSEQSLTGLYKLLTSVMKPYDFFRDRYSCLTLLTFIERCHKPASELVLQCIMEKPYDLFRWSVFRYFLEHVTENAGLISLQSAIYEKLVSLPHELMSAISENGRTHRNYLAALELIKPTFDPLCLHRI